MLNGIQMAVDEINAVGGYSGRKLEIVKKDDEAKPDVGFKLSNELVAEKVIATIGFCNTGVAAKSLDVFQANKLPLIIPCSTGTPLTAKFPAAESYIFRTSARDAIQAPFVVEDIVKRGWNKVAIFADTSGYGEAGFQDVEKALAAKNIKPVYVARFALGVKDLSEELKAAKAAGANVIFSYTVGVRKCRDRQRTPSFRLESAASRCLAIVIPLFHRRRKRGCRRRTDGTNFHSRAKQLVPCRIFNQLRAQFKVNKIPVPMAAAQGYDAVYILLYSLFNVKGGNFNGQAIKTALENKIRTYYGVVATYEQPFSSKDKDATTQNMLVMGMVKNGAVTFAYPQDAKNNLFVQRKQ